MKPDPGFIAEAVALENLYLATDDPEKQSGYSGGRERWIAERSPIGRAIDRDGSFLDVGCANGRLLEDLIGWAADRGFRIEPHGIDIGPGLVEAAKQRLPEWSSNLTVADAWEWNAARRYTYVYSLLDTAPDDMLGAWIHRLAGWVESGGRLILGAYGSRSRAIDPPDPAPHLTAAGLTVEGTATGGEPVTARYAWVDL